VAEDLAAVGHEVFVITTQPHYNRDHVAEQAQPLRRWRGGLVYESRFRGIRSLHIAMPAGRERLGHRLRGWLGFHVLGFVLALESMPRADVIIVPSPLLTAGVVAWAITKVRGGSYIYNVQELYPELAIQMGRLKNPLMIGLLRYLERFVYRTARAVVGISQGICDQVIAVGAERRKVHMIPNFVDLRDLTPLPRDSDFSREHDLGDAFVVLYAGNMGHAQGLETVLDAAEQSGAAALRYVLIGNGVLYKRLEEQIRARRLTNVTQIGHQPYARMPEIYAAADVCLVPLLEQVTGSALPSKIFRIMACGRPVLALCNPESELADLVRAASAGVVVPPGRPDLLSRAAAELATQPEICARMGRAGREFVIKEYARPAITGRYAALIDALA